MWTLNSHQTPLHSILSRRQTRRRRVKQHQHVVSFHNLSPFNLSIPLTIAYLHHTFSTWLVRPQVEWSNKRQEQKQLQHVQAKISRGTFPVPSPLVPPLDLVVEPKRALRAAELALMSFRRNTGMSLQQKVRGNMAKLDMAIMKGFFVWPICGQIWILQSDFFLHPTKVAAWGSHALDGAAFVPCLNIQFCGGLRTRVSIILEVENNLFLWGTHNVDQKRKLYIGNHRYFCCNLPLPWIFGVNFESQTWRPLGKATNFVSLGWNLEISNFLARSKYLGQWKAGEQQTWSQQKYLRKTS